MPLRALREKLSGTNVERESPGTSIGAFGMRFDDRLMTMLVQPAIDVAAKAAIWAQIADLLAQDRSGEPSDARDAALCRLRDWRADVPQDRRRAISAALSNQKLPADIVTLFGSDEAVVAAPLLSRTSLDEGDWLTLIPTLGPTSRALLRERRDLSPVVIRMLASYGQSDFALPGEAGVQTSVVSEDAPIQIRDLVARIEAYRRDHPVTLPHVTPERIEAEHSFRFETQADGMVSWVEGVSRGALIGLSIADLAEPGMAGVDGHVAGAFRQRNAFASARMSIAGASDAGGEWVVSGKPVFNPLDGRFLGYRGAARRPRRDEVSRTGPELIAGGLMPDSIRQLVHELRTPLNAMRGFSEMIAGQVLGPVSHAYRQRAAEIVRDSVRLLGIFDDLDTAARLDSSAYVADTVAHSDVGMLLRRLANEFRMLSDERELRLQLSVPTSLPEAAIGPHDAERLIGRFLSAVIGVAGRGETIGIRLASAATSLMCEIDRPKSLDGMGVADLRASMIAADANNADAPALGLGFSLRLVETMSGALGGAFAIDDRRFSLILPVVSDSAGASQESG
jgi:His Kinase A (phospho-acceptor) domain